MNSSDDSARRQELRAAAARLFRKVGFGQATVRDIAAAVGMQSGSIFYYFKTKEVLFAEVFAQQVTMLYKEVGGLVERPGTLHDKIPHLPERHVGQVAPGQVHDHRARLVAGLRVRARAPDLDVVPHVRVGEEALLPEREPLGVQRRSLDPEPSEVLDEPVDDVVGRRARAARCRLGVPVAPVISP